MPYRTDPLQAGRHPFELFTLFLALLTSLPTVLGIIPEPGSVAAALPPIVVVIWSWLLLIGSGLALIGIYRKDRATGLILEQLGLAFAGMASIIYAGCVIYSVGWSAIFPAAVVFGFGVSCIRRYFQIQQTLDAVAIVEQGRREGTI